MRNTKHKTIILLLTCSGLLLVLLPFLRVGGKVLRSTRTSAAPPAQALPHLQPHPDYLLVYPEPGRLITALEGPPAGMIEHDPVETQFNVPVAWKPGNVCVLLVASSLLQVGDFWEREEVLARSTLTLNARQLKRAAWVDGISGVVITDGRVDEDGYVVEGEPLAQTGGPYGICWHGPISPGQYVAEFRFAGGMATSELRTSYTWWYQITD